MGEQPLSSLETITCRECSSSCVCSNGTIVCSNCGLANEEDLSLLQASEERDLSFRGYSTSQPFCIWNKDSTTREERAAKMLFSKCKEIFSKLALDSSLSTPLNSLVTSTAQLVWPCYKHWLSASSAACVYIVARMHSKAVNMTDCSIAANCLVSDTGRVYQQLVLELKLQIPPGDPFVLLWRVCNVLLTLLFPNSERNDSCLGSIYPLSCNLLWYAEQRWLLTGRKPMHVVIAATTLAATCCGLLQREKRRQLWIDMSKHLSSTEQSIRQRYNEFIDALLKDAKLWLPWADQIDRKNIHQNIPMLLTILGYCSPKEGTEHEDDNDDSSKQIFLPPCVEHTRHK